MYSSGLVLDILLLKEKAEMSIFFDGTLSWLPALVCNMISWIVMVKNIGPRVMQGICPKILTKMLSMLVESNADPVSAITFVLCVIRRFDMLQIP